LNKTNDHGDNVFFAHVGNDEIVRMGYNHSTTATEIWITSLSTTVISTNQWYHLAFTYNGSIRRLYINGVKEAEAAESHSIPSSSGNLHIGSMEDNGQRVYIQNTFMDDVRLYNRALSHEEILAIYSQ
jgi:hypothetical protein